MSDTPSHREIAEGFLAMAENMAQVVEFIVGYRAQLEAAGFSPTAAEMGAMEMHSHVIAACFKASNP